MSQFPFMVILERWYSLGPEQVGGDINMDGRDKFLPAHSCSGCDCNGEHNQHPAT